MTQIDSTKIGEGRQTFFISSLGCPKNLVDSEVFAGILGQQGWAMTEEPGDADLIVVNTCAFIEDAQRESVDALLSACASRRSGSCQYVVAAGCLVQHAGDQLSRAMPEIDLLVGVHDFPRVPILLDRVTKQGCRRRLFRSSKPQGQAIDCSFRQSLGPRHYRYLKIAEGCSTACGFCIIPKIRGAQQSVPSATVLKHATRLLQDGAIELLVVAQDSTAYGADFGEPDSLPDLLLRLSEIATEYGKRWIRVLYLHPHRVSDPLIAAMAQLPILPYFDISLQHSSPTVLKAMRRALPPGGHRLLIERIRQSLPHAILRSTILLGHPGETSKEFDHLLSFIEWARLDRVGVFLYSAQAGTFSASLDAPSYQEVSCRQMELDALLADQADDFFQRHLHELQDFLVDGPSNEDHLIACRPWTEAPEIDWQYLFAPHGTVPVTGSFVHGKAIGGRAGSVLVGL